MMDMGVEHAPSLSGVVELDEKLFVGKLRYENRVILKRDRGTKKAVNAGCGQSQRPNSCCSTKK